MSVSKGNGTKKPVNARPLVKAEKISDRKPESPVSEEVAEIASITEMVAPKEKAVVKTSDSSTDAKFTYIHNPSENPKVLEDAIEDKNAIYGYSPNPSSDSIGEYANDNNPNLEERIDWGDPQKVAEYRARREEYHRKNDNISELVIQMKLEGHSTEEIARAANRQRNENRLNDYILNNDYNGLERAKRRNVKKYGNENGPTAESMLEKYGSWERVIEKAMSANPGMDACCGLYDKYYHLYGIF